MTEKVYWKLCCSQAPTQDREKFTQQRYDHMGLGFHLTDMNFSSDFFVLRDTYVSLDYLPLQLLLNNVLVITTPILCIVKVIFDEFSVVLVQPTCQK